MSFLTLGGSDVVVQLAFLMGQLVAFTAMIWYMLNKKFEKVDKLSCQVEALEDLIRTTQIKTRFIGNYLKQRDDEFSLMWETLLQEGGDTDGKENS